MQVEASAVFVGALLCRDRTGAVRHRVGMAWTQFWAARRQFTTRAFSLEARLQRLRAKILAVITWGSAAWRLRPDIIGVAEKPLGPHGQISPVLVSPGGRDVARLAHPHLFARPATATPAPRRGAACMLCIEGGHADPRALGLADRSRGGCRCPPSPAGRLRGAPARPAGPRRAPRACRTAAPSGGRRASGERWRRSDGTPWARRITDRGLGHGGFGRCSCLFSLVFVS